MERRSPQPKCATRDDGCLCSVLHDLYAANELPLYRGRIARTPLAASLGYPAHAFRSSSSAARYSVPKRCIGAFDEHLRANGHGTVWEEKVPRIAAHLDGLSRNGGLPTNSRGDLNRAEVLRKFGLGNGSAWVVQARAPRLKDLLDRYDAEIDRSRQGQYKYAKYRERLQQTLAREDLKLTHDRIISRTWLAKEVGIGRDAFSSPCLDELVERKQAEIDASRRSGESGRVVVVGGVEHLNVGCTPYSDRHGRVFNFADLVPLYGLRFAERLGTAFLCLVEDMAAPKQGYARARHFLKWLAGHSRVDPAVVKALRANELPNKADFEYAALMYREELFDTRELQGGGPRLHPRFSIIERLGELGIFPRVTFGRRKRGSRSATYESSPRPTLAEAEVIDENVLALATDCASATGVELPPGRDTVAFVNCLAIERSRRSDLPDSLPEAIRVICEERLDALRRAMSEIFSDWHATYVGGKRVVDFPEEHPIGDSLRACATGHDWNTEVSRLFPAAQPELALANAVRLVRDEHDGVCPVAVAANGSQFWRHVYGKVGGQQRVQQYLLPPRVVVSAAVCLYLCESGANVSVALSLSDRALRPSRRHGHVDVIGNKQRARGKPIYTTLSRRSLLPGAISAAESMSSILDALAASGAQDKAALGKLFVHPSRGRLKVLTEWQLREDCERVVRASPLKDLKILPSMIRPTVLLAVQLRNPGNIGTAQVLAQHSSPTTTLGYLNKLPYRMISAQKVREFSDSVQVRILATDRDGESDAALNRARHTGMGVICRDPLAGAQPDFPKGKSCQAIDRCLSCSQMLVAASPPSVASMILWREALVEAESRWLEERYDRWVKVWLSWKVFFDVILEEKMSRGPLAGVRREAKSLADAIRQSDDYSPPMPF